MQEIQDRLRRLAASEPKQARAEFRALFARGGDAVESVLNAASRPGEGRLRQMIATVYRMDPKADSLEPWLREWLAVESDEFTRSALENALATRNLTPARRPARNSEIQSLEAYQFVSGRLCHSVRNAMPLPNAQISKLQRIITNLTDEPLKAELTAVLGGLKTGFARISRAVEFDIGDDYLVWQSIPLIGWLQSIEGDLVAKYGPARMVVVCEPSARRSTVRATRFLLETIFGNLWSNAVQVMDGPGPFTVEAAIDSGRRAFDLMILDAGPGFPEKDIESAFQQGYSTKSQTRGRGLLEIADAVKRLQGNIELCERGTGDYRVRIILPLENG